MMVRRNTPLWTVVILVGYWSLTFAQVGWAPVAEKLSRSVVFLQNDDGSCTGFVIHTSWGEKHDKDLVLSAAHCYGLGLYVDQEPAKVVSIDKQKDLLVLEIDDTGRPALRLAKSNPKQGDSVASFGYGYGLERPMLRITTIADDNTYIPENGIGGPLMVTDAAFVSGQSGGPCVNAAGEVVMIVQRASGAVGLGVGAETIKSKTGKYWEQPAKPQP